MDKKIVLTKTNTVTVTAAESDPEKVKFPSASISSILSLVKCRRDLPSTTSDSINGIAENVVKIDYWQIP